MRVNEQTSAGHGKIRDIEVLRGTAILFVLAEHTRHNLFTWTSPALERFTIYFGGWTGVDLFFAISGFVIARGLVPKLESQPDMRAFVNAAIAFWVRRAWRLIPAAWLWLAVILVAAALFNRSGAFGLFHTNFQSAVAALLDLADFRVATFYAHHQSMGASFPYWSLSLEEQFYLLLPWMVLAAGRRLPILLAVLVLAQLLVDRTGPMHLLFNVRSDALALGVLVALWARHPTHSQVEPTFLGRSKPSRLATFFILVGAIGALGANGRTGFFDGTDHVIPFRVGLIAILSAALVLIASFDRDYFCPEGAAGRALLWLGSRSYTLYLVHIPAFAATREIWYRIAPAGTVFEGTYTLRYALTALILLIVATELTYRLVEAPLRRHGVSVARDLERRLAGSGPLRAGAFETGALQAGGE